MHIPQYRIEEDFEEEYAKWFMQHGYSLLRARQAVQESIQSHAAAGFRASLLASVFYFGRMYAGMYPERMRPVPRRKRAFTLAGYRPEVMQTIHVPGWNSGEVNQDARRMLMGMRLPAEEAR